MIKIKWTGKGYEIFEDGISWGVNDYTLDEAWRVLYYVAGPGDSPESPLSPLPSLWASLPSVMAAT